MAIQKNTRQTPETKPENPEKSEQAKPVPEVGGPKGKEPTRYGDWEKNGRCIDF